MKLKSKLVLAASALLVLSGAAAGTGTYAWYTANRQVSLAISNIGAQAQVTNLSVALKTDSTNTVTLDTKAANDDITLKSDVKLTDVSGNGAGTFAKPIVGPVKDITATSNIVGWWANQATYTAAHASTGWYQKFTLTFTATGTEPVSLFLSPTSTVTDHASSALSTQNAVRYSAMINTTEMFYCNPNGASENTYWTTATATTATENTVSSALVLDKTASTGFFSRSGNYVESGLTKGEGGSYKTNTGFLADLAPVEGTPATLDVVFYAWIEGTDAQCIADTDELAGSFDMSLKFYTLLTNVIPTFVQA